MDAMKKLKDKKGMHKMHPMEQKAKLGVLGDLRDMAQNAMGDKLKGGMGKVTVASNSPQGLQHGLNKAQDMVGQDQDPDQMMAEGGEIGEVDPLKHLPEAFDDSHPDHENFAHTENHEDGEDGDSAYPDADDDHPLEADPMEAHEEDEHEEMDSKYDDMDEDELDKHIEHLMSMKQKKGMAK